MKACSFQYCSTVPSSSWWGMLRLCLLSSCSSALAYPLVSPTPAGLPMYTVCLGANSLHALEES